MGKAASAVRSQREALRMACESVKEASRIAMARGWRLVGAYLVGSRARGDYTVESDVDVVLVIEGVEGLNALERLEAFKEALRPNVELRVYATSEWTGDDIWMSVLRREAKFLLGVCKEF
ncbi:MAG: nucleotidyltransferase domain-containing protein [Desulfurococcales archaeon]|nr:nucleotidyltransferase domain-containing protein [Desulfurococcales archaeon]